MLSVVLPSYNHGQLIARALKMLLAQERLPDEIIIVEDGSSDDSLNVVRDITECSSEVRFNLIVNKKNRGAVAALAQGLKAARGQYVYFAAADDWVLPGFFADALEALQKNPDMGLFCGEALLIQGNTGQPCGVRPAVRPIYQPGPINPNRVRELLASSDNWILTGSAIFRRDAIIAAGGFDNTLGSFSDGYLARKIALTNGFFFSPTLVSTWSIFPGSVSRQTVFNLDMAKNILEKVPAKLKSDDAFPHWYPQIFQDRWRFSTARLALAEHPPLISLVNTMASTTPMDRRVVTTIGRLPFDQLIQFLMLAWLWFRLQPLSLFEYLRTSVLRRIEQSSENARRDALALAKKTIPSKPSKTTKKAL
jgi:glycosyltransferase involved in cell wall biosynthesis